MRHERDVGRRLHEESIRLQQRLASIPLPTEEPKGHRLLTMGAVLTAVVLIALAVVLLPPGSSA